MALVIAMAMMLPMSLAVFAAPTANSHTITIKNTDQNVDHTYNVYQVFSGNLNADEDTLSDIAWGSSVNGVTLLAALQAATDEGLIGDDPLTDDVETDANIFASCTTAQDVAEVIATLSSTATFTTSTKTLDGTSEKAGALDAVATIIGDNVNSVAAADADGTASEFTQDGTSYTATVYGDGYYIIKDETETLQDDDTTASDTLAKYMLTVIRDETIVAKDTGLTPDKEIVADSTTVKADSAAIGDTVNFQVTVTVPNTVKYDEDFWFVMNDTLPAGITFTGITSVKIDTVALTNVDKASPAPDLSDENYNGSAGYYTLTVNDKAADYAWEATDYDAVLAEGGQAIAITFNQFKTFVETKGLIGKTVTIDYTGVVNDDAEYEATENENEVTFTYSTDPNYDYDGDNPDDEGPTGTTPKSTTRTYTTSLKILKVDEDGEPLEGATFELKGTALNRTVVTGYMFVEESYEAKNGEVVDTTASYWKLLDGSYTTTDPSTLANTTQYESTETKYYKVTYTQDEIAASSQDLVVVTDSDGVAEFVGLNEGEYTLEEIAAPDGYNKLDGQAAIAITWEDPEAEDADETAAAQGGFTLTAEGEAAFAESIAWNETDKQFEVTIENQSGTVLPSTGGIGTTIFYVIGAILVIGAGVIMVTRRRMDA